MLSLVVWKEALGTGGIIEQFLREGKEEFRRERD